ncbi:hypothetical protein [Flectobacillus roseus]|uniref:hypothetical protein n=1 Tax=Flectobacillus roseus TaxID=502259 RepID=UPI0024B6B30E|nr:hypothetical protein [Flectobacillus roseus]MDI9870584.1 hypothetical protein [Flectobacillus roseus]
MKIQIGRKQYTIPTTLKELSKEQYFIWCEILSARLLQHQFNIFMMFNLLGMDAKYFIQKIEWNNRLKRFLDKITFGYFSFSIIENDFESLTEVARICEIFSKDIKIPTENKLPTFSVGFRKYKGPEEHFGGMCFRQYRKAEEYFARYLDQHKIEDLDLLIAWLYAPVIPNKVLSKRRIWNPAIIKRRAKNISKLDSKYKFAVFLFYLSNRQVISKAFKFLFSGTGSADGKVDIKSLRQDLEKSVRILSGNVNQDEQTDFQPVLDVLSHLNDNAEAVQKLKAQNPQ